MDTRTLNLHARWWLRREAQRLKWRGFAGIALAVVAVVLAIGVLRPTQRETVELRDDVAALRAKLRSASAPGAQDTVVRPAGRTQLENFYAFFPAVGTLPDWLGEVHLAAARHGLVLETGEYRLQHPPGARLARYELELPLKGTYPQLRAFLADVLKKIPAAAVDDVVIRRETVASPQLDAKVRLFVYLGGGS